MLVILSNPTLGDEVGQQTSLAWLFVDGSSCIESVVRILWTRPDQDYRLWMYWGWECSLNRCDRDLDHIDINNDIIRNWRKEREGNWKKKQKKRNKGKDNKLKMWKIEYQTAKKTNFMRNKRPYSCYLIIYGGEWRSVQYYGKVFSLYCDNHQKKKKKKNRHN